MRTKRYAFLIHRWTGVGMCLLMALWFVSGIIMLFIGYPKLTPWERLGALPVIEDRACCITPDMALSRSKAAADVKEIVLTSIRNQPHYLLREGSGDYTVVDAISGNVQPKADVTSALAGARAFIPHESAEYVASIHEDRWTHSRSLDPHRPLHVIQMNDPASTRVYVSSSTGQVVLDVPNAERLWNYVGAWLHWLYMLRSQAVDPAWTWSVIVISAIGMVTAFTGILNGIWRWRFARPYKNGSKSPFREVTMRWHHILGLVFGAILFTWIFSGLMSMNPVGIFDAKGARPDIKSYQGGSPAVMRLQLNPVEALSLLKANGFLTRELEWRVMNGKPFLLARDGKAETRLVLQTGNKYVVTDRWPEEELMKAAARLIPAPVLSHQKLEAYDAYYYKRGEASMYGANERRLPALRIVYGDPGKTWVHLDVRTGQVELSMDQSQRLGRWFFNLLHSWDLPAMLNSKWLRELTIALLSLGGLLLSATGLIIAFRRISKWQAKSRLG